MIHERELFLQVTQAFARYVSAYDPEDPKIRLKIDHTYRVAELSRRIAAEVDPERTSLAWLIGMLHDIGRFEQIRRYNTFIDADSVDHANFGADLLFREGLLDTFAPELSQEERALAEISIRSHSLYRIPDTLTGTETRCCNILRDADKLDIFRVTLETPLEDIYNVTTKELRESAVSDQVKDCFRKRTAVLRSLKHTAADNLVGHICLVFELVYPVSLQISREQGYLEALLSFSSDNPDTAAWFHHMQTELHKLLSPGERLYKNTNWIL